MSRTKSARQEMIRQLLERNELASQEDIVALLATEGIEVTQATLSRDLRDLGVRKIEGRYVPQTREAIKLRRKHLREAGRHILEVRRGGTIVVLLAREGQAPALTLAIREADPVEMIGIMSDLSTVFIATGTAAQARSLARALSS